MNAKITILIFLAIFMINCVEGNKNNVNNPQKDFIVHCLAADSLFFEKISDKFRSRDDFSILDVAKSFINRPYEDGTLETGEIEKLVVNFHSFDCVTFMESSLALFQTLKSKGDFGIYLDHLRKMRYSDGQIVDYGSRLHYFSAWMINNEKKGRINILFQDNPEAELLQEINFMLTNRDKYPKLKNDTVLPAIQKMQMDIRDYQPKYIPQEKIEELENDIRDGDIIALVTSVEGLDVSHTGFAIHTNGRLHLLHASSKFGKVLISEAPLADYIKNNRLQKGIMVSRITDLHE